MWGGQLIKAYNVEKQKWLCAYLKQHLTAKEENASVFIDEEHLDKYIIKIGLNPINFQKIRCDYRGNRIG